MPPRPLANCTQGLPCLAPRPLAPSPPGNPPAEMRGKPDSRDNIPVLLERMSSQPFLTEEQRAALDAALALKREEQPCEWLPLFGDAYTLLRCALWQGPAPLRLWRCRYLCRGCQQPLPAPLLTRPRPVAPPPSPAQRRRRRRRPTASPPPWRAPPPTRPACWARRWRPATGPGAKAAATGKAAFTEAPKSKRELAHDHHLSRKGKGE